MKSNGECFSLIKQHRCPPTARSDGAWNTNSNEEIKVDEMN